MKPTDFAYHLSEYLGKHLPGRAGLSANTIMSYRDTFSLLLRYCRDSTGVSPEKVTFAHITKELIEGFLDSLANERGCSAKTINQRLAAIHAFFRYLQTEAPEELFRCQQILAIGFTKVPRDSFVEHISLDAVQAILAQPNTESLKGRSDLTSHLSKLTLHKRKQAFDCERGRCVMFNNRFGIEIEFTGITRERAAAVAAEYLGGVSSYTGGGYIAYSVTAPDGRVWKFVSDGSITARKKERGRLVEAGNDYRVELVSPILTYREDIDTLQELVRRLRNAGGFAGSGTGAGIHIHLDGAPHTPVSVRNFINIIASKNDLFYKALQIEPDRMRYCKKMDSYLVERMNSRKPKTFAQIESIWYEGYTGSHSGHYHDSRYHFLNLHSFFTGHRTIELRGYA